MALVVDKPTGRLMYDPGSGIPTEMIPAAGLTTAGQWVPLRLSPGGVPLSPSVTGAVISSVLASVSSVLLAASNPNRSGIILYNNAKHDCYIAFNAVAVTGSFSLLLVPGATYSMDEPIYTGPISGISSAAGGAIQVTEF